MKSKPKGLSICSRLNNAIKSCLFSILLLLSCAAFASSEFLETIVYSTVDSDNDGIIDDIDIDDDNDGILDSEENCFFQPIDLTWHGTAQSNLSINLNGDLDVSGSAWANAYSDQYFSYPISIEGTVESATNGMLGIIPVSWTETSGWNDGGFKFQFNASHGMLVRHGSYSNGWVSPSILNTTFKIEIDQTGKIDYWHDGTIIYSGYIPDEQFKITLSRGSFTISNFTLQKTTTNCNDLDQDGIINSLDLDSDGDGCSDSVESGNTSLVFNNISSYNTGSDSNLNGLLDQFENSTTGGINYSSVYHRYAVNQSISYCQDFDNDDICDVEDIDDDNDGVLDLTENCYTEAGDLTWHGAAESDIKTIGENTLSLSGTNWANVYSDQTFSFPLTLTGTIVNSTSGMLGLIPITLPETSNWNDNGFKFQFNRANGMYVRHKNQQSGWHGPSIEGTKFRLEIDSGGNMEYYHNGNLVHTGTIPDQDLRLTISRGNFIVSNFSIQEYGPNCKDQDLDGNLNQFDLDSDGDSCSDSVEADNSSFSQNDISNINTGTDSNQNGLLDQFEDMTNGGINYTSTFNLYALNSSINSCIDTDGDGVENTKDIDDDNDGVLDYEENCTTTSSDLSWHGAASANVSSINNQLFVSGNAWANTYSDQTFKYPFTIEGTVTEVSNGMIGIIPISLPETSNWNDGAYKFQFNSNNGMYVRHNNLVSGWHSPSIIGTPFKLEVDEDGIMSYWHNGNIVFSDVIPDEEYKITMSRGYFGISDFKINKSFNHCNDLDQDGTINSLDLDSDGDGCSDSVEANNTALDQNNITTYNSGTDSNGNGLLDQFEDLVNGGINYVSYYSDYATNDAFSSCLDTDNDLVPDVIDIDDDNDGVLDDSEKCSYDADELSWHGAAANNIIKSGSTNLIVTGNAWANAYTDQTFSFPFIIEGTVDQAVNGMIGILPIDKAETTSWNDGAYKFQFNAANGMLVRHGSITSGWQGPSIIGTTFRIEVDSEGTMNYWHDGNLIYSGNIENERYKLSFSRGSFRLSNFSISNPNPNCDDIDSDGTPNHLDLDSDGDGCSDSVEANNTVLNQNNISSYNTGTDTNGNGLLDQFEDLVNGGINYQSEYHLYAIDAAISSCLDTDNDLVPNIKDLDDDNDGLLDFTEKCYLNSADFSWHGAAQANILSPSSSVLQVTGNAWSNAYSDQTFSIPFSIEGEISGATNGMIGVLPSASAETSSWNDGGFKFQLNSNNGFLVRHGNSTNGWHGPSANGSTFKLEVDASGTMNYWYNGTIVYSNTIPDVEYKITISRGRFIIKDFALQKTSTNCNDIDLDGTPNYLDIDSDGDGCYDSVESGIQFEDIKTDGSISGNVDSQGIPLLANGGLENNMYVYDGSETAINCCDDNIPTEDCDLDGYTNQEELNGICGFIGDPLDINSPFAWQSTTASGTTDDNIFILESQSTPGSMKVGRTAHLTIKDGHELTLNSDISIRDLILEDGALLDLNGFTAVVSGNLVLDGTIIHNLGHIHMRDDCEARTISGNKLHDLHDVTIQNVFGVTLKTDLNISGVINPLEGDFDLNNQALTLTSELLGSSVQTGSIGEIQTGADISGEITIQRYVQSSEDGFRLIGSPIQNLTIADLHDDIITTGFTGSDYPSHWYTNVSYYDETNRPGGTMEEGFQKVTNTTNSITDYHGVWAYFAPSNTSATLDSQGEFNKGEITIPLSFTPGSSPGNSEDGWHCIINPYPSAIDLDSPCIEFNNVGTAVYILDHTSGGTWQGEYAVYNNGVSINGGSNVVASYQAFMVQATGPGAYLKFNECAKTDEQGIFLRSGLEKDMIRLSINQDSTEYETIIAYEEEASAGFDQNFDARKISATSFSVFSLMNTDTLGINTLPYDFEESISLLVHTPLAGNYELNIKEILGLENRSCLSITDLKTNESWNIEPGLIIPFNTPSDGYHEVRFVINKSSLGELEVTQPSCFESNTGVINFDLAANTHANFNWSDDYGHPLLNESGESSTLVNLRAGFYHLEFDSDDKICGCGNLTVEISDPKEHVIHLTSTPDYCSDEEGKIQLEVEGAENWSANLFKDYQVLQSQNSSELIEFDNLRGGVYDLAIETECIYSEHVIDITDIDQVIAHFMVPDELIIHNQSTELEVEALSQNNTENQWYLGSEYLGGNDIISITFNQIGNYTLSLNSSNNKCHDSHSQQIFVSAASDITENLEQNFIVIDKLEAVDINLLAQLTADLEINLYDANGRLIFKESNFNSNTVSVDKSSLSNGVYFLEIRNKDSILLTKKILK